jgi:hypothetical protein
MKHTRPNLIRDDRGVILVVGVFFTFLWIGVVWFIFGVGNAIAYRENMQNAADAAAFSGAVYNARGMNLIAMINNLMGVLLATVVAMKILQIINLIAKGLDCHQKEETCLSDLAACIDIFGGEVQCAEAVYTCPEAVEGCISDCDSVNDWKDNKVPNLDKSVHAGLQAMHEAQGLVAKGWPFIAMGKSSLGGTTPNFYANGVVSTTSYSYSQNPSSTDPSDGSPTPTTNTCPTFNTYPNFSGTTSDGVCSMGPRCGLPVTSDHYSSLCKVAIDNFFTLGSALPSSVTAITGYGTEFIYDFMGEWLCDDHTQTDTGAQLLNTGFNTVGTLAISVAAFWECTLGDDIMHALTIITTGGSGVTHGDLSLLPMSGPDIPNTCPAWSPMAIYAPAVMGNDFYGVWGSAAGAWKTGGTKKDFAQTAVQISALEAKTGTKTVADPPSDSGKAVARAEFYYEPYGTAAGTVDSGDTQAAETTVVDPHFAEKNVMWNMRWRARLRRFHFMPGLVGVGLIPGAGGVTDEAEYLDVVLGDSALLKTLLLNVSGSSPGLSKVTDENNNPPLGLYH